MASAAILRYRPWGVRHGAALLQRKNGGEIHGPRHAGIRDALDRLLAERIHVQHEVVLQRAAQTSMTEPSGSVTGVRLSGDTLAWAWSTGTCRSPIGPLSRPVSGSMYAIRPATIGACVTEGSAPNGTTEAGANAGGQRDVCGGGVRGNADAAQQAFAPCEPGHALRGAGDERQRDQRGARQEK